MDTLDHKRLALWAADCAERVLPHFEEVRPTDTRPRRAVEAGRAWAGGKIKMSQARTAAFDAHAAAREVGEVDRAEAVASARAAGHAAATAHVATHAPHAANYAIKAVAYASDSAAAVAEERNWQYRCLPEHLRPMAFPNKPDG